jgi:type I restriction enzyme S subunit
MPALRPYPAYKDTDLPWLAQIPAHWEVKRLKFVATINPSKSEINHLPKDFEVSFLPMELVGEGTLTTDKTKTLEDVGQGFTYFRNGDVVVAKITPSFENGKGAIAEGLVNGIGFGTTELHVVRPSNQIDKKFLYYLTISNDFRTIGAGMMQGTAGQKRVPDSFLINYPIAYPSLPEQQTIAAYLDRQTAKIDALIARKQRLLDLLAEQRAALISQAVTKGLPKTSEVSPLKDSGVAWLGQMPSHWEVKRVKTLTPFVTSGSRWWAQYYSDDGALFIRIGNISNKTVDIDLDDVQFVTPPKGAEMERTRVRGGDVLISITANIGSVGVVPNNIEEAYVNQHIALTRPSREKVNPRWMAYVLISSFGEAQFQSLLYGGTKDGLGLDDIQNLKIPLPPIEEQNSLVDYLDQQTKRLSDLATKIETAIVRLREYRAALISSVVTGKVMVKDEGGRMKDEG